MKVMMRMDRLRRSLRDSFRRRKPDRANGGPSGEMDRDQAAKWAEDEQNVRRGSCSFVIKYFGCIEVFESRGMQVCEEALKMLRASKRKPIRGKLLINGDGVRIVDDETRGLVLDILIEKISFCSPDRNHERGFAWISRDGTTRRWICHGVMASHDTGERLSHAMGCAFGICLERKQQRERDQIAHLTNSSHQHQDSASSSSAHITKADIHNGTSHGITRSASSSNYNGNGTTTTSMNFSRSYSTRISRVTSPPNSEPLSPPPMKPPPPNPHAIERRHAPESFMARAGSLRIKSDALPFKRQYSLRIDSASTAARHAHLLNGLTSPPAAMPPLIPSPVSSNGPSEHERPADYMSGTSSLTGHAHTVNPNNPFLKQFNGPDRDTTWVSFD